MKAIAVLWIALFLSFPTHAADRDWTGDGGNGLWSNPNNWSPAGIPQPGEQLIFTDCTFCEKNMVNDLSGLMVGSLYFREDYTLGGNALTLTNYIAIGNGTVTCSVTINSALVLGADCSFGVSWGDGLTDSRNNFYLRGPVNLNGFDLEISARSVGNDSKTSEAEVSGPISGAGNVTARAWEHCYVSFLGTAANTFTGELSLSSFNPGHIRLEKQGGVIATNRVRVTGGTVNYYRADQIGDLATVEATGGKLNLRGFDDTVQNLVMRFDPVVATEGGTLTVVGDITGGSSTFTPAALLQGKLSLPNTPHSLIMTGAGPNALNVEAEITGAGGFNKSGSATLQLSGPNTFTGNITISEGQIEANHVNAFGSLAGGVFLQGGSIRLNNLAIGGESLTVNQSGLGLSGLGNSTWGGPITLNQQLFAYAENLTFSGAIGGTAGLFVFGNTVTLAGNAPNTFTGDTEMRCELLQLNKSSNIRAFSGRLLIGGSVAPLHEVRWLNNFQFPNNANVIIHPNGLLALNNFTDIVGDLTFNGGRINLASDSAFTLTGTVTSHPTNVTAIIDGATGLGSLFLSSTRPFNVGRSGLVNDMQIDARIAGSGLIKNGEGTLALRGPNQFSGAVTIYNGILRADHNTALGTAGSGTTVNNGGTLWLGANADTVAEPVSLNGTGYGGTNGALTAVLGVTLTGNVVLQTPSTIRAEAGAQFTINSLISGTGPLTKTGSGALTFAGTSPNTYTGDTLVTAGALQLDKSDFVQAVPGSLIIGTTSPFPPSALVRHFSQDQIWASVTVSGGGLLDLNGYEEYLVALNLNSGGDVSTGAGLLTVLPGNSINVSPGIRAASSSISGRLGLRVGTHTIAVAPFLALPFDSTPELDLSAAIVTVDGVANINKAGTGSMRLSGNSTFTGNLDVNEGTVFVAHNNALGATQGSTTVHSNALLALDGGIATGERLVLDADSQVSLSSINGSNIVNGVIQLSRPGTGFDVSTNNYLQLLGPVSGPGGLTKFGPGTMQFGGNATNTYASQTVVYSGELEAGRVNQISIPTHAIIGDNSTSATTARLRSLRGQQFNPNAQVIINRSGSLDLSPAFIGQNVPPAHETFHSVRGEGKIFLATSNSITFSNNVPFTFGGSIGGSGAVNKRGSAAATMTGSGLFSSSTTIYEGEYVVHGNFPNSPITVGLLARLAGDGVVNSVYVGAFSTLAPLSEFPGHLGGEMEASSLTLGFFGNLELDFFGPDATGGNDSLAVSGDVFLGLASLTANFKYAPRAGDVLTLIRKLAAGAIPDTFSDWPQGTTRVLNGIPVQISYTGGDGNDVTLTVTNLAAGANGAQVVSGNGNGLVEPDECNLLYLGVQNRRNIAITLSNVVLRSTTPGALVTIAQAVYPTIPALGSATNLTPFQLRTLPGFPCNTPVTVELEVTVANEGTFAMPFTLLGGTNCNNGGGGCESCHVMAIGQITNGLPTMAQRYVDTGASSTCNPRKPCPGPELLSSGIGVVRYAIHRYTNSAATDLCVTALLQQPCGGVLEKLQVGAYRGSFNPVKFCDDYLGDSPTPGTPLSFTVPAGQPFEMVVCEFFPGEACATYTLELFGLPCPLPTLHIAKDAAPNKVILDWSSAYPGWRLQSVNSLNDPPVPFADVPAVPAIVNSRFTVTNTAAEPARFHRLTK